MTVNKNRNRLIQFLNTIHCQKYVMDEFRFR